MKNRWSYLLPLVLKNQYSLRLKYLLTLFSFKFRANISKMPQDVLWKRAARVSPRTPFPEQFNKFKQNVAKQSKNYFQSLSSGGFLFCWSPGMWHSAGDLQHSWFCVVCVPPAPNTLKLPQENIRHFLVWYSQMVAGCLPLVKWNSVGLENGLIANYNNKVVYLPLLKSDWSVI